MNTHFYYEHTLFWAEPGKEIEITTNKLTTMCLKYGRFSAWRAFKSRAFKKNNVYFEFYFMNSSSVTNQ